MDVLFENKYITVCLKQFGISSEDIKGGIPEQLRQRWGKPDAYVGVVHRLDQVTGGVMVYARNKQAAAELSRQIAENRMAKEYVCLCAGKPEPHEGQMENWLFKDSRSGKVFPVKGERKGAKYALLDYTVLRSFDEKAENAFSLCRVRLHTGRTHQIRVQFASRKHPLLGDGKYGSRFKEPLALWCRSLTFTMPGTGETVTFEAPPPEETRLRACMDAADRT